MSDDDVNVLTYQRPIFLTGIDFGALRNDLAERMMPLELQPLPRRRRRTAGTLWSAYERAHPRILGALPDLAAEVWAALPYAAAELTERPRLADFAELLHALDRVTGWHSLDTFNGGTGRPERCRPRRSPGRRRTARVDLLARVS